MKLLSSSKTSLTLLATIACLSTLITAPASAQQTPTTPTYQQTDALPPTEGSDHPGAQMGHVIKETEKHKQSTLGHYSHQQTENIAPAPGILGMDVSAWQTTVDWEEEYAQGARFAYIKSTEGTYYKSKTFSSQYLGADRVGMLRGAYHFAIPADSSGAEQARHFVANGGGWSADGRTLPGLLDIEYNPYKVYGDVCFNMTSQQMIDWIRDFTETYRSFTGRYPAIYTTTDWWMQCTGNTSQFNHLALHLARYSSSPGTMPAGWATYDIWQYTDSGPFAGDSNIFNGNYSQLRNFATNANYLPLGASATGITTPFKDVPSTYHFFPEIRWLANTGITTGWEDGTFRPTQPISRAAMAAFIYRMAGSPAYTPATTSPFRDLPTNHPFYLEISWLKEQGITTGWEDGTFRPEENISRAAMAAFLHRLAGEPLASKPALFKDVTPSHLFAEPIAWLAESGITTGWEDGTFRPEEKVTREAMAAFIYRYHHRN